MHARVMRVVQQWEEAYACRVHMRPAANIAVESCRKGRMACDGKRPAGRSPHFDRAIDDGMHGSSRMHDDSTARRVRLQTASVEMCRGIIATKGKDG